MSALLLLLLSLAVLFTPGCPDSAEPTPSVPAPLTEPEPIPGLISDKWYAEYFDDQQSAWLNAVWTVSEYEGKPSVHDHTVIERRSVRGMSGMEDRFVARTVIDVERGTNGDLYWIRVVRTEGDPELGGQVTVSEQRFTGDGYELTETVGDLEEKRRVDCDAPVPIDTEAFLSGMIRRGGIATGRELTYLSPDFRTGKMVAVNLEVTGTETLSLSTGPCLCFKVREAVEGRPGESLLWLDAEGTFRQARTGRTVLVSTTKNRAQDISEGGHEYSIVVHATPSIPRITSSDRSVIEVELEERMFAEAPDFPDSPFSREIERRGNIHVLELLAHDDPEATVALPVVNPALMEWLESTNLLCAAAPRVVAAMREAIGDEKDGREVAKLLLHYVFKVLKKASGPVLSPNAAQILEDGGGDCSEHAVLFVALCRAAGLPARLVSGYAQVGNHWGSHSFTEVWLGKWVGADPTTNELGTKARYICFGWPGMDGSYPGLISDQVQERLTIRTLEFTDEGETVDLRKPLPREARRDFLSGLHFAAPPAGWDVGVFHGYESGDIRGPSLSCNVSVDYGMGDLSADLLHSRLLPYGERMSFAGIPCVGYRIEWEGQASIQLLIPAKRRTLSLDINLVADLDAAAEAKAMATLAEILAPTFLLPAKLPPDALAALTRALEDPDRGVRFAAANGLGKAGPAAAEAVPALARAVLDDEGCVRMEAVWALSRIGEAAFEAMLPLLDSENPAVRLTAARALFEGSAEIKGEAESALLELVGEENLIIAVHAAARLVEAGSENTDAVLPPLKKCLIGKSWQRFQQARPLLLRLGPKAIPSIRAALSQVQPWWQSQLLDLIARIQGEEPMPPEEEPPPTAPGVLALPVEAELPTDLGELADLLTDDDPVNRESAVFALVRAGDAAVPHLIPHLVDGLPRTAALAARVMGEIGPEARTGVAALLAGLTSEDVNVRIRSALALGRVGDIGSVSMLAKSLTDEERDVRVAAAIALGSFGTKGVAPLRRALLDTNWRVRRHALESLARIGPEASEAAADVTARLTDDTMMVTFAARYALEAIGSPAALPLAREISKGHYGVLAHGARIFAVLGPEGHPAVPVLIELLLSEDVNLREVAARALGDIGSGAVDAVPHLIDALMDTRIGVRDRAALALGRIGREGLPALLVAAEQEDARVRAGAVFAIGWITGEAAGFDQAAVEFRLPVAYPGPVAATGSVPTPKQTERARSLALLRKEGANADVAARLTDLTPSERVGVLRAGLRSNDLDVAVTCAGALTMDDLDGWESERAVELLLPDCPSGSGRSFFGELYEYLGSEEIPAVLHHYRRSYRVAPTGALHRLVRADCLPELYRLARANDPVVSRYDGDIWMPAGFTDRFREEDASLILKGEIPQVSGPGLPAPLVGLLRLEDPFTHGVNRWLSDSTPRPRDAELLISLARGAGDEVPLSLIRALAKLEDEESAAVLEDIWRGSNSETRERARAALVARGNRQAMRAALAATTHEPEPGWEGRFDNPAFDLDLLFSLAPDFAGVLMREILLDPERHDHLLTDFEDRSSMGARWSDTSFLGFESAILTANVPARRLSWIAHCVPGCRTKRVAARMLDALERGPVPGIWFEPDMDALDSWMSANCVLPLLEASWPDRLRDLLRKWSRSADAAAAEWASDQLLRLGDPESAARLIAFATSPPGEQTSTIGLLSRSACPEVEEFLSSVALDDSRDLETRREAFVALLECRGLPESVAQHYWWTWGEDEESVDAGIRAAVRSNDPVADVLARARESEGGDNADLGEHIGNLKDPRVRAYLRERIDARRGLSVARLLGQLALNGDAEARRELWAGVRMGRYRWICYQNDNEALSLGRNPETFPWFHYESESNCCRGGHCDRLLGEWMGDTHLLGFMSYGEDATPSRACRWWMDLNGGRFTRTSFGDDYERWTLAPE